MPLMQCLGYDIFDCLELVPEFIADIGIKKGEKTDYAFLKDEQSYILKECQHRSADPDLHNS
jgi:predicted type IV restriction endonuclease